MKLLKLFVLSVLVFIAPALCAQTVTFSPGDIAVAAVSNIPPTSPDSPLMGAVTLTHSKSGVAVQMVCLYNNTVTNTNTPPSLAALFSCTIQDPPPPPAPVKVLKIVQEAFGTDTGTSNWNVPMQPTTVGNTVVVLASGNPNGSPAPMPVAAGLTFAECTACAAVSGDRFESHVYYALKAGSSISSVNFYNVGSAASFAVYELSGVSGLDSGGSLSSSYGNDCGASVTFPTQQAGTLLIGGLLNVDTSALSGEAVAWKVDNTDSNGAAFVSTQQAAVGQASLNSTFAPCYYGRPTISVAAFY